MIELSIIYRMFTDWLLQQTDTPGATGRAAKVAWDEINNGMISSQDHGVLKWREHLQRRLGEKADSVIRDFLIAYFEFKKETK